MSMFGLGSDYGFLPSYYLAEITEVNVDSHTVSVVLLRGQETYQNVMLVRDPGNYSLPTVGDLGIILWDNRNKPIIIGTYPVYHKNKLDTYENYKVEEGDALIQSEFGQKLLFNKRGEIILTNRLSQGLTMDQDDGLTTLTGDTINNDTAGVDKRGGYTKRYSPLLGRNTTIKVSTSLDVIASTSVGTTSLVEDATIITDPITSFSIYENKIGNSVIMEDTALSSEVKTVATHPTTNLPLRQKVTYYNDLGTETIQIYVDKNGATMIDIPSLTAAKFTINGNSLVDLNIAGFKEIDISATTINIGTGNSTTKVNLGAGSSTSGVPCNNFANCLFTGAPHATPTQTTVVVPV